MREETGNVQRRMNSEVQLITNPTEPKGSVLLKEKAIQKRKRNN